MTCSGFSERNLIGPTALTVTVFVFKTFLLTLSFSPHTLTFPSDLCAAVQAAASEANRARARERKRKQRALQSIDAKLTELSRDRVGGQSVSEETARLALANVQVVRRLSIEPENEMTHSKALNYTAKHLHFCPKTLQKWESILNMTDDDAIIVQTRGKTRTSAPTHTCSDGVIACWLHCQVLGRRRTSVRIRTSNQMSLISFWPLSESCLAKERW